jgi:diacylglycerol kinase family enzyme
MYGYNFTIAPDARTDDGKLEVVILKDVPRWQYFAAVPSTLNGKIYKVGFIEHYSAGHLTIHSENALYAHVDGEGFMAETSLVFSVKPGALYVLAPRPANG